MDATPIIARLAELEATTQDARTHDEHTSDLEAQLAVARALLIGRDERIGQLEAEIASTRDTSATAEPEKSHLLFVPSAGGYRLVERSGPAPVPGDEIELEGLTYRVTKRGRAPLPGDGRRCAYLVEDPSAAGTRLQTDRDPTRVDEPLPPPRR